jgi:phosphorylase kinase alpha/beta subunit
MNVDFDKEIEQHLNNIRGLRTESGLFTASSQGVVTGYDKAWLRDVYFIVLSFLETGDIETTKKAAKALLTIFVKHKDKIDWAIQEKPHETWQFIHARFHPETFEEFWEEWGNKQHDAVGEVLNLLVTLELMGESVIETEEERNMIQKIVYYLCSIEYWHDADNGIWEENLEIHASSVGSVVAALQKADELPWLEVPHEAIRNGQNTLRGLLPRESKEKFCDLALLTLLYPFKVATEAEENEILKNVEYHLAKNKGVIRYKGDRYYNNNFDGWSEEAEWCFGHSWLAIIYAERGDKEKAYHYLEHARSEATAEGLVPELYYSNTDKPNENTPLGWAESMLAIALQKVKEMEN